MSKPLFLDETPGFLKEAAYAARLSETPENWPQELSSELYKQLPFLSDYEVNVNLDRVDPQRGAAFGYADVANKTERPEVEHDEHGMPHMRIPLIVESRAVRPFSTVLDGERVMPLTEDRVRETLFNPNTFDISSQMPRDPSLVEPLMPPTRSGVGMGGETKMASADPEMLKTAGIKDRVYGAIRREAAKGMVEEVKKHKGHIAAGAAALTAAAGGAGYAGGRKGAKDAIKKHHAEKDKKAGIIEIHVHKPPEQPLAAGTNDAGKSPKAAPAVKVKKASLFQTIAPTITEEARSEFIDKLANDAYVRAGLKKVAESLVEVFDKTKRASAEDMLAHIAGSIEPTVVTFMKLPGGDFLVKQANFGALNPQGVQGQVVPGAEVADAMGPENAAAMMPGQTATVVANPIELDTPWEEEAEIVEQFGEYKVQDTMGNTLMGWVFPQSLAWDGSFSPSDIAIFSNGSAFAMQDSIAGVMIGKSTALPSDHPMGEGVLYMTQGGNAICTQPFTIKSAMAGPDGLPKLICSDVMGQQFQISFVEGLSNPMRMTDIEYAFPKNWNFMRLNNQTQLQGGGMGGADNMDPEADMEADMGGMSDKPKSSKPKAKSGDKKADKKKDEKKEGKSETGGGTKVTVNVGDKAKKEKTSAVLWYNGGYNIDGGCGLHKIAADLRFDMSPVDAEFMLGLLGVDGITAKEKVAEARRKGSVKLAGLRSITTLAERYAEAEKTAAAILAEVPDLRKDLIKEAAALEDKGTIDNLLALNFINPENLSTFTSYLPELEETSEKLSEMLLYNYLGQNELPEQAIYRSMKAVEEVIQGLKAVASTEQ